MPPPPPIKNMPSVPIPHTAQSNLEVRFILMVSFDLFEKSCQSVCLVTLSIDWFKPTICDH